MNVFMRSKSNKFLLRHLPTRPKNTKLNRTDVISHDDIRFSDRCHVPTVLQQTTSKVNKHVVVSTYTTDDSLFLLIHQWRNSAINRITSGSIICRSYGWVTDVVGLAAIGDIRVQEWVPFSVDFHRAQRGNLHSGVRGVDTDHRFSGDTMILSCHSFIRSLQQALLHWAW